MTPSPEDARPPGAELGARTAWIAVLLALAVCAAIRVRLLEVPFERDEGEYAYGGQLLLDGVAPFRLLYNMKLPGTQFAYALSMAAFGESIAGARLGLLIANAATTLLLFGLGRRLLGELGGAGAAVVFAFLSLGTEMLGLFGHATHFVALAAVGGLWLFVVALERGRMAPFAGSGLLLGVAVLMKQPGAVFAAFALVALVARRLSARPRELSRAAREVLALAIGIAAPLAAVVGWLAGAGVLETSRHWVFDYGAAYGGALGLGDGATNLRITAARFLPEGALLWLLAGLGLALAAVPRAEVPRRGFLVALLGFAFAGVCPGLYFRGHYFLLALPAVALLAGAGLYAVAQWVGGFGGPRVARAVAVGVLASAGVQTLWAQREVFFRLAPAQVSRAIYGANPFPESLEIGRYLGERTGAGDTIAVLGSEPQIYFYAGRRSATGFVYMYPLMERHPFARRMQEQLIRELEAAAPAFVVWVRVPTSWLETPASEPLLFEWSRRWLPARYDVTGQVLIGAERTEYRWQEGESRAPVDPSASILVLRRKDFVAPPAPLTPAGSARPASS